jgi:hypothetical protein
MKHMRARVREEGESLMETATGALASAAMGAADAAYGDDAVFGTSVPAIVAGVGLVGDLTGWAGDFSPALRAAGRAGLNIEAFRWAGRKYREWDEDSDATPAGE